jgi:5-(carboxyamino)imidazole ribonucleotide mutase
MPAVAVLCGSRSDLPTLKGCFDALDEYGVSWEASVISAHRQADALHAYVAEAEASGVQLFIGAAGLAAHLPGVLASLTAKPVIGVPLDGGSLGGADASRRAGRDGRHRQCRGEERGAPRGADPGAV